MFPKQSPQEAQFDAIASSDEYATCLIEAAELVRQFGADVVFATDVSAHPIKRGLEEMWSLRPPERPVRVERMELHLYPGERDSHELAALDSSPGYRRFKAVVDRVSDAVPEKRDAPPMLEAVRAGRSTARGLLCRALGRDSALKDAVRVCIFDEYLVHGAVTDGTMSKAMDMVAHASHQLQRKVAALICTIRVDFVHYGRHRDAGMHLPIVERRMPLGSGYDDSALRSEVWGGLVHLSPGPEGIMPDHTPAFVAAHSEEIARYERCVKLLGARAAGGYERLLPEAQRRVDIIAAAVGRTVNRGRLLNWWDHPSRGGVILADGKQTTQVGQY